jgi:hypothetical protein
MLQDTNSSSMVATSDNMSVLPRLASCQGAITILCGCTVLAALGRRYFWESLAWHAGLLFGVTCKSLIERIRRNLELAIAFHIFYASKRARSIIKQSIWFDENILPILAISLYATHLNQTLTPTFTVICWTEMSWWCSSHIISTLMLAFSVL